MVNKYDNYIDVGNMSLKSVVKFWNGYYKIVSVDGSNKDLTLNCEHSDKIKKYIDLNYDFIKFDNSVYEFDRFIPVNTNEFKIKYKLFLRV